MAYATSTDPSVQGAYVRIQGPRLWIEIDAQGGIVTNRIHFHSIRRDEATDYGG